MSVVAKRLREARFAGWPLLQRKLGIKAGLDSFAASTRINRYERRESEGAGHLDRLPSWPGS